MIFLSECTVAEQPESTTVEVPPAKTPEEIQEEAEQKGWLDVDGPKFSIFPPWIWWNIKVKIDSLDLLFRGWIGLGGFGIKECKGLENILIKAVEVPEEVLGIVNSALIKGVTTAAAAFAAGAVATKLTRASPWCFVALAAYYITVSLILSGFYLALDTYTARALLFGTGFALLGFAIGMLGVGLLTSWHIAVMGGYLGGSDAQEAAAKATINAFIGTAAIVTVMKFGLCLLDQPFLILTAVLGITAISLALMKS